MNAGQKLKCETPILVTLFGMGNAGEIRISGMTGECIESVLDQCYGLDQHLKANAVARLQGISGAFNLKLVP